MSRVAVASIVQFLLSLPKLHQNSARMFEQLRKESRSLGNTRGEQVAAVSRQTLKDIREAVSGYRRPTLAVEIITARYPAGALAVSPGVETETNMLLPSPSGRP